MDQASSGTVEVGAAGLHMVHGFELGLSATSPQGRVTAHRG